MKRESKRESRPVKSKSTFEIYLLWKLFLGLCKSKTTSKEVYIEIGVYIIIYISSQLFSPNYNI
jgi:hypothetical protein